MSSAIISSSAFLEADDDPRARLLGAYQARKRASCVRMTYRFKLWSCLVGISFGYFLAIACGKSLPRLSSPLWIQCTFARSFESTLLHLLTLLVMLEMRATAPRMLATVSRSCCVTSLLYGCGEQVRRVCRMRVRVLAHTCSAYARACACVLPQLRTKSLGEPASEREVTESCRRPRRHARPPFRRANCAAATDSAGPR